MNEFERNFREVLELTLQQIKDIESKSDDLKHELLIITDEIKAFNVTLSIVTLDDNSRLLIINERYKKVKRLEFLKNTIQKDIPLNKSRLQGQLKVLQDICPHVDTEEDYEGGHRCITCYKCKLCGLGGL